MIRTATTTEDNLTKRYYETHAEEYFRATHAANLESVWRKLTGRLKADDSILDLGCGSGRDLRYFFQHGFRATGIDYSSSLVELARAFSRQPVVLGDFASLPFGDDSFDAVWAIGSLLHVSRSSLPLVFSEIHRVLKGNSCLLTSVKEGCGEAVDSRGRYNVFYSLDEWVSLHRHSGYEVVDIERTVETRKTERGDIDEIVWIECLARAGRYDTALSFR